MVRVTTEREGPPLGCGAGRGLGVLDLKHADLDPVRRVDAGGAVPGLPWQGGGRAPVELSGLLASAGDVRGLVDPADPPRAGGHPPGGVPGPRRDAFAVAGRPVGRLWRSRRHRRRCSRMRPAGRVVGARSRPVPGSRQAPCGAGCAVSIAPPGAPPHSARCKQRCCVPRQASSANSSRSDRPRIS